MRGRAVALLKDKGVRLPTFAELAEPARVPTGIRARARRRRPRDAHPLNLYRVHWFNDRSAPRQAATPRTSSCPRPSPA